MDGIIIERSVKPAAEKWNENIIRKNEEREREEERKKAWKKEGRKEEESGECRQEGGEGGNITMLLNLYLEISENCLLSFYWTLLSQAMSYRLGLGESI